MDDIDLDDEIDATPARFARLMLAGDGPVITPTDRIVIEFGCECGYPGCRCEPLRVAISQHGAEDLLDALGICLDEVAAVAQSN